MDFCPLINSNDPIDPTFVSMLGMNSTIATTLSFTLIFFIFNSDFFKELKITHIDPHKTIIRRVCALAFLAALFFTLSWGATIFYIVIIKWLPLFFGGWIFFSLGALSLCVSIWIFKNFALPVIYTPKVLRREIFEDKSKNL